MKVPPVSSAVNGPNVSVVPSGFVTFTVMLPNLSPYMPFAVGVGIINQKPTVTFCPKPAGFGETLMKAYVGIRHAGLCASVVGKRIVGAEIERIRTAATNSFLNLFCMFSPFR